MDKAIRNYDEKKVTKGSSPSKEENTVPETVYGDGAVCNSSLVRVRKEPSTNCEIVEVLRDGEIVEILDKSDGFYKVKLKDGRIGYIASNYCFCFKEGL